jgi:hypothetical protein
MGLMDVKMDQTIDRARREPRHGEKQTRDVCRNEGGCRRSQWAECASRLRGKQQSNGKKRGWVIVGDGQEGR